MRLLNQEQEIAVARVQATTSDWALDHVHHVERIAGWLFDALREFHGYGQNEESLLRAGALLHDVGYPVDPDRHHKVSARIVREHLGPPFTADQVELIALLARYHRKSLPRLAHKRYRALDDRRRRVVVWLGGILRVADGLDRGHDSRVHRLRVTLIDNLVEIRVVTGSASARSTMFADVGKRSGNGSADPRAALSAVPADLEIDIAGASRKRDLLERALGMPVLVRAA